MADLKEILYGGRPALAGPDGPDGLREVFAHSGASNGILQSILDSVRTRKIGYTPNEAREPGMADPEAYYGHPLEPYINGEAGSVQLAAGPANFSALTPNKLPDGDKYADAYSMAGDAAFRDAVLALGLRQPGKIGMADIDTGALGGIYYPDEDMGFATSGAKSAGGMHGHYAHEMTHRGYKLLNDHFKSLPLEERNPKGTMFWHNYAPGEEARVRQRMLAAGLNNAAEGFEIKPVDPKDKNFEIDNWRAALVHQLLRPMGPR